MVFLVQNVKALAQTKDKLENKKKRFCISKM